MKGYLGVSYPDSQLAEVLFNEVQINDDFWLPKIKTVQEAIKDCAFLQLRAIF